MNKNTQIVRLLAYFEKNKYITQLEALNELGIFRLASRINDLKRKGYVVGSEFVDVYNRFGEKIKIKKYFLAK